MERECLSNGKTLNLHVESGTRSYVIDRVIGRGAHCIVYTAHSVGKVSRTVRIKECYPANQGIVRNEADELVWPNLIVKEQAVELFVRAYEKQIMIQNDARFGNTFTHIVDDLSEANNTLYIIIDIDNGKTFLEDITDNLQDILKTIKSLASIIGIYHKNGYLYLDLKPENFLILTETRDLIKLLDSDTVVKEEDILSGRETIVPYTAGWAAPEQVLDKKSKISEKTDIYSIGAILFWKIMGRYPNNDDIGVYAEYEIPQFWSENYDTRINTIIKRIFRKTITASIRRRYESVEELIEALNEALKVCSNREYILPKESISDTFFVGRTNELHKLHELLSSGIRVVFLHGFGGIGKTELAKRYAQIYKDDYDVTVFGVYNKQKGLNKYIQNINVIGYDDDDEDKKWRKLEKLCTDKTLFIVDDFDVDDDKDIERLISLNAKIFFTSRNDHRIFCSDKIVQLELNAMDIEELLLLFAHEFGRKLAAKEEKYARMIIKKFDNYTMLVPLIARHLKTSDVTLEEFWRKFSNEGISGFGDDSEEVKHRKDGVVTQSTLLGHMKKLFDMSDLDEKYKYVLANLKALRYHRRLTRNVYREYTGEKNLTYLNNLMDLGWVEKEYLYDQTEENDVEIIHVHPVVEELIDKYICESKYYNSINKHTYDSLKLLNENPNDAELRNNIANVLCVYCVSGHDDHPELIYYEMYKYILHNYKNGELDIYFRLFMTSEFTMIPNDRFFWYKLAEYIENIIPNDDSIPDYLFMERVALEMSVEVYNRYFYHAKEIDLDGNSTRDSFITINYFINSFVDFFDTCCNDEECDVDENVDLAENDKKIKVIEDYVNALTNNMCTRMILAERWIINPKYDFTLEFDVTRWPEIAGMYLSMAKLTFRLSKYFEYLSVEEKKQKYWNLYKELICILSYYQGIFLMPDVSEPEEIDVYYKSWEDKGNKTGSVNGLPVEMTGHMIVNLLFCTNRVEWRKKLGESFEQLISFGELSALDYKVLLDFDFLKNQPAVIRKCLLKHSIFDRIYSDNSIDEETKKYLLINFISSEIGRIYDSKESKERFIKDVNYYNLYYGCLKKYSDYMFRSSGEKLTKERFMYYCALSNTIICNKRKNLQLVESIGKEINIDNLEYVVWIQDLIKVIYNMGERKIANDYYRRLANTWKDREEFRKKYPGSFINYLYVMKTVTERIKDYECNDEVLEELEHIPLFISVTLMLGGMIDEKFVPTITEDGYWGVLTLAASALEENGYEAWKNSKILFMSRILGQKISQYYDEIKLVKRIKLRKCYEMLFDAIDGTFQNTFSNFDACIEYIRVYLLSDRYKLDGHYVGRRYILLASVIFGKAIARAIIEKFEENIDEKTKREIVSIVDTYPVPEINGVST